MNWHPDRRECRDGSFGVRGENTQKEVEARMKGRGRNKIRYKEVGRRRRYTGKAVAGLKADEDPERGRNEGTIGEQGPIGSRRKEPTETTFITVLSTQKR